MALPSERVGRLPAVRHPRSVAEALEWKRNSGPEGAYVAGGTLLRTWWEAETSPVPRELVDLRRVSELSGLTPDPDGLTIGAMTLLADCTASAEVERHAPLLIQAIGQIAAPSVRNWATIGGNVVSRVGDSLPALLVHGAELLWAEADGRRAEPLERWLGELRRKPDGCAAKDSLLAGIWVPRTEAAAKGTDVSRWLAYGKVGRRESFTPSVVTMALGCSVGPDGKLTDIVIAAGGGQTIPCRLRAAEALADGAAPGTPLAAALYEAVEEQYAPVGDAFADAAYRKRTAANWVAAEIWKLAGALDERTGGRSPWR